MFEFQLEKTDGGARAGTLTLPHGTVQTPAFMPVGTHGAVLGLSMEEVRRTGAQIVLGNTYRHPAVVARFQSVFDELARHATGSSTFVSRAVLLDVPPSLDAREITDKGSINQKAVLRHREALVEDLYSTPPPAHVIVCGV